MRAGGAVVGGGGLVGFVFLLITVFAGGDLRGVAPQTLDNAGPQTDLAADCRTSCALALARPVVRSQKLT